jgi:hypothetical protein
MVQEEDNVHVNLRFFGTSLDDGLKQVTLLVGSDSGDSSMSHYRRITRRGITVPKGARMADVYISANINHPWTSGLAMFNDFSVTSERAWLPLAERRLIAFSLLGGACIALVGILFRASRFKENGCQVPPHGFCPPLNRSFFMNLLNRQRFAIAFAIIMVSSLCLIPFFNAELHDDVRVYRATSQNLLDGKLPYRDTVVEYPPYALGIFLLPRILPNIDSLLGIASLGGYPLQYMALTFLVDFLIKLILFYMFCREPNPLHALLPVAFYSLAVPFTGFIFLQRYDVWPALICLLAVWANRSGCHALCGLAIAAGMGVKLYPAVIALPLFILALRERQAHRFILGLAGGLLPMLLAAFWIPWWRFFAFQGNRGLQAESLYSIILWMGRWLGFSQVSTVAVISSGTAGGWMEVQGPAAQAVLPWVRSLFVVTIGISTLAAGSAAWQCQKPSAAQVSRILLLPLVSFIVFNQVLSPQFMIWLLPLAAVACSTSLQWEIVGILLATMFTPVIFHSFYLHGYVGFDFVQTDGLMLRNFILVLVWVALLRKLVPVTRIRQMYET